MKLSGIFLLTIGSIRTNILPGTASPRAAHPVCGGYNRNARGIHNRGYTETHLNLWPGGVVEYSFVSNGDSMKDEAFFVDSKVGFSAAEMTVIMKAMKRIEDRTCIRFQRIEPESGKYWVLMMKEGEDGICYREYISQDKIIANLGKPFEWNWDGDCFGGA